MTKYTATTDVRARFQPNTANNDYIAGVVKAGTVIDAEAAPGADGWLRWRVPSLVASVKNQFTPFVYALAQYFKAETVTPPDPKPDARYLLGVSCLNDHAAGMDALARGCRSVLFMDGLLAAIQAAKAYPDAIIWSRMWFQHAPDPKFLADHQGAGLMDVPRNLYTTGPNESDWFDYDTPQDIRQRFEYERDFALSLWARNPSRMVVLGEFSHGTPDTTRPEIVREWVNTYGAFAKANPNRVRLGWHLYTYGVRFPSHPGTNRSLVDPVWFEGRDAEFWKALGSPAEVKHVCGETGVESGQGGFTQPGYSSEQFAEWCAWWLTYRRSLPVTMEAACIFQYGSHQGWRGYDVRGFAGVLGEFWSGKRQAAPTWRQMQRHPLPYDPPPTNYAPAAKGMAE
jgi:hypothetical protein